MVRFVSDVLLSAPSILIGLFVYELLVEPIGGFSGIAGSLALAVLVIPIVVRTTEDMLRLIPATLREAAMGLGAPKWKMIMLICYRAAKDGIVTGVLLAVARIAGETAPLLFTSLGNLNWSLSLTQPMASLPVTIYQYAGSAFDDWVQLAWVGALLITVGVLAINIIARVRAARQEMSKHEHHDERSAGTAQASMSGLQARSGEAIAEARIAIRDLDFYYGSNQALKKINLDLPDRQVTGMIGPSGCGKSTLLRVLNRMYDLYPGQRATGEVMMDGDEHRRSRRRSELAARPHRHGVPEADAVPDDDLRQHRLRREAAREALARRRWTSAWNGR